MPSLILLYLLCVHMYLCLPRTRRISPLIVPLHALKRGPTPATKPNGCSLRSKRNYAHLPRIPVFFPAHQPFQQAQLSPRIISSVMTFPVIRQDPSRSSMTQKHSGLEDVRFLFFSTPSAAVGRSRDHLHTTKSKP